MIRYTTIEKVRQISGFDDTTKITDEYVESKICDAAGIVDSSISTYYQTPVQGHIQNCIEFSGDATEDIQMDITVNSVTYSFDVANGDSSATVANKFRNAASSSVDFVTNPVGSGSKALLVAKDCTGNQSLQMQQVTVDSISSVGGITTNVVGFSTYYPETLNWITAEIAADLILSDNYGVEAQDTPKDGNQRLVNAMNFLKSFQEATETTPYMKIMDNICGTEIPNSTFSDPEYLPNEITNNNQSNPTTPNVGINTQY